MLAEDAPLKVLEQPLEFENRRHFFGDVSRIMVNALIDHQRRRQAQKRGGDQLRMSFSGLDREAALEVDLGEMPAVLDALEALDARKTDLVRLRVFWGATMEEAADWLGISLSSAERDWRFARRWLAARLQEAGAAPD